MVMQQYDWSTPYVQFLGWRDQVGVVDHDITALFGYCFSEAPMSYTTSNATTSARGSGAHNGKR